MTHKRTYKDIFCLGVGCDRLRTSRKSQIWSFDFLIGFILFMIILFIFIKAIFPLSITAGSGDRLYPQAAHLSSRLLTPGYPSYWNSSIVLTPGLAVSNRIDTQKLKEFDDIEYYRTKTLLQVSGDYVFFFRNSTSIINVTGNSTCRIYGYPIAVDSSCEPVLESIYYDDLARIERLVIYDSQIVTMVVYVWD